MKIIQNIQVMNHAQAKKSTGVPGRYSLIIAVFSAVYAEPLLCDRDAVTGQEFEHRRQWIVDKLLALVSIFTMHVCAYAVLSNHFHVVVDVEREQGDSWSVTEVIQRWHRLFSGSRLLQRFLQKPELSQADRNELENPVNLWRQRLADLSWYMRVANKSITLAANRERLLPRPI